MTYPDRVRFKYTDWLGRVGSGLYYFPEFSDPAVLGDFVTAVVQVIEPAYNTDGLKKIIVVDLAGDGPYASYTDQMILEFTTAGDNYEEMFTGPKASNFLPDTVTVDTGNPDISDLIAFLIANGTDSEGNALLTYVQGWRRVIPSAADDLLNASDFFTVGITMAEFYQQHGMDVKATT